MEPRHDHKVITMATPGPDAQATYEIYKPRWVEIRQKHISNQKTAEEQKEHARRFNLIVGAMRYELSGPGALFASYSAEQKDWYIDSTMHMFCFPALKYPFPCPPARPQIESQPKPQAHIVVAPHSVIFNGTGLPTAGSGSTQSPTGTEQSGHLPPPQNASSLPHNHQGRANQVSINEGQDVTDGENIGTYPAQEQPQSFVTGRPALATAKASKKVWPYPLRTQADPADMTGALAFQQSGDPRQMRQGGLQQTQRGKLEHVQHHRLMPGSPQLTANEVQQMARSRPMSASPQLAAGHLQQTQRQRSISTSSRAPELNPQRIIRNRYLSASSQQALDRLQYSQSNASMSHSFPNGNLHQMQQGHPGLASPQLVPLNRETVQNMGSKQDYFTNGGFQQIQQHLQMPGSPQLATPSQDFMEHNDIHVRLQSFSNHSFQQMQHNGQRLTNVQQMQQTHPHLNFQGAGAESIQRSHTTYVAPQFFTDQPPKTKRIRTMSNYSQLSGSGVQCMQSNYRASASPQLPPGAIQNSQPNRMINPSPQFSVSTLQQLPTQGNDSPTVEYHIPSPPERLQQSTTNGMISPTPRPRTGQLERSQHQVSSVVSGKRNWDSFQEGEE